MSKNKRRKHCQIRTSSAKDFHHILFTRRHWQKGFAKLLREHPYMGKYIPMCSLHHAIHQQIFDVPCPSGKSCKQAYEEILRRKDAGTIDVEHDTIAERLDLLIELWEDTEPETVEVLKKQREIVTEFYEGR